MNAPSLLSQLAVRAELAALGLTLREDQPPDPSCCFPQHAWLVGVFLPWWQLRKQNLPYIANQRDCDKFAWDFCDEMEQAFWERHDQSVEAGLLCGQIEVDQLVEFGGVPAGGRHMLNLVRTEAGWFVLEPQTATLCALADYPNASTIIPGFPEFP